MSEKENITNNIDLFENELLITFEVFKTEEDSNKKLEILHSLNEIIEKEFTETDEKLNAPHLSGNILDELENNLKYKGELSGILSKLIISCEEKNKIFQIFSNSKLEESDKEFLFEIADGDVRLYR